MKFRKNKIIFVIDKDTHCYAKIGLNRCDVDIYSIHSKRFHFCVSRMKRPSQAIKDFKECYPNYKNFNIKAHPIFDLGLL